MFFGNKKINLFIKINIKNKRKLLNEVHNIQKLPLEDQKKIKSLFYYDKEIEKEAISESKLVKIEEERDINSILSE